MPLSVQHTAIPGVLLITPSLVGDARGFFLETYKRSVFAANGINETFVQINQSSSAKGVLRGLHFQEAPHEQGKLVRVLRGEIFDVAVDIRPGSPTRGQWVGNRLSADNHLMMYLPGSCAHGFCVLSEHAEVLYMTTAEYAPSAEAGIMWNDPTIGIEWPIASPTLSERDKKWPPFS